MAQKSKSTDTPYDHLIKELRQVKKDYRTLEKGYRSEQYELMARTMAVALAIKSDRATRSRFLRKFGEAESKDVVYSAMIFMSGAKSEKAKKKAWKRARALSYLVDELHVSTADIPDAVKKHHGIEALVRLAARKQPRRKPPATSGSEAYLSGKARSPEDEDANEAEDALDSKISNVRRPYQLGISPKQWAKLERFPHKTRLKMVGYLRTPSDGSPTFEVQKIVKLKAPDVEHDELAESDDWA